MKLQKNMTMEQPTMIELDNRDLLAQLRARKIFPSGEDSESIKEVISTDATKIAEATIFELKRNIAVSPGDVMAKIIPRAESWGYQNGIDLYSKILDLDDLSFFSSTNKKEAKEEIDNLPGNITASKELSIRQWWAEALVYEARAAVKRRKEAVKMREVYCQELTRERTGQFKRTADSEYGDMFNRLVCQRFDQIEASGDLIPDGMPGLRYAASLIEKEIFESTRDEDLAEMLTRREIAKKKQILLRFLEVGRSKFGNNEKAVSFAALSYELDRRKTDKTWGYEKFQEILSKGFQGEEINFITMLCTINQFNLAGGYKLVPNLDAYLQNPKLEPVPLIINEMVFILRLFRSYGVACRMDIFVSDTDYTEIGQYGSVSNDNLANLQIYIAELKKYVAKFGDLVSVLPISLITDGNEAYLRSKTKVLESVSKFKDLDFTRDWYRKFETAVEKVTDSQSKRGIFPKKKIRQESLEITRRIWACNAAQGVVFSNLGANTVLISTERRERDGNYVIDKEAIRDFPPVLYVLSAAESWNRKLMNKTV